MHRFKGATLEGKSYKPLFDYFLHVSELILCLLFSIVIVFTRDSRMLRAS